MQLATIDARELTWTPKAGHTAPAWSSIDAEQLVATAQSGQLVCRIGSASANGVVYDMMLDKSAHAALKLKLFATGPQADEVTIATFISRSVLATHSTRFPVVYGSATCHLGSDAAFRTGSTRESYQTTTSRSTQSQPYLQGCNSQKAQKSTCYTEYQRDECTCQSCRIGNNTGRNSI
jgi:hypothetical protein